MGPGSGSGPDAGGPHLHDAAPGGAAEWRNETTRVTTAVLAVTFAVAGFHHGFFEALQGSRPTDGWIIQAVGPEHRLWPHGTEEAFTLIPDFLWTGMAAMAVSVGLAVWAVGYLEPRRGARTFLGIMIALTLVGGGLGHIAYFVPAWAWATRMDKPLTRWRRLLGPERLRRGLARAWLPLVAGASALFLVGLEISVFGVVPGLSDPDAILAVCWLALLASLVLLNLAYPAAFARDLEERRKHGWAAG